MYGTHRLFSPSDREAAPTSHNALTNLGLSAVAKPCLTSPTAAMNAFRSLNFSINDLSIQYTNGEAGSWRNVD
jgi:hypothetical protein